MKQNNLVQLCSLWAYTDKVGDLMLVGKLGNSKILIFKNKKKKNDKSPDFYICLGNQEKSEKKGP